MVLRALRIGLGDQWRRSPPERRRRAVVAGAVTGVCIVVASALAIAEPWGSYSVLYVLGIGGGAVLLMAAVGVSVLAIREAWRGG